MLLTESHHYIKWGKEFETWKLNNDYYQKYLKENLMHILWRCEINSTRYYSWITRIFDIVKLNIVLFNWLDSEEYFKSTNNLSNKTSISMLVTNYDQYFDMKPKDYEEIILNSRLIKEVKHRKRKSGIIEKEEVLCKDKSGFVTELS